MNDTTLTSDIRTPVLVVVRAGNWIEVFGPENVYATIVNAPFTGTVAGEVLAEEYLDVTLPRRMAKIYAPGNRRAADLARIVTPSDIAAAKLNVAVLRTLNVIEEKRHDPITHHVDNNASQSPEIDPATSIQVSPAIAAANRRAIEHRKHARRRTGA